VKGRLTVDHAGGTETVDLDDLVGLAEVGSFFTRYAGAVSGGLVLMPLGGDRFKFLPTDSIDRIDLTWEP